MDWRQVFGAYDGPGKGEDRYKTDNNVTLPNSARFTGDKWPEGKNVAKTEVEVWKEANSLFLTDNTREDKGAAHGSAITGDDVKRKNVAKHIQEGDVHRVPYTK